MTQPKALEKMKNGDSIFLTGEPGSGKTYTINLFTDYLEARGIPYAVTASTGIAATHIGGTTIHSWCGIGIKDKIGELELSLIEAKEYVVEKVCDAEVLIIDEISMLDANTLDNVEKVCRYLRHNDKPFGGLQVILVGDFFQLPPVSKRGPAKFAFEGKAWEALAPQVCYLTEQHRQSEGEFLALLTAMRAGKIEREHRALLLTRKNTGKSSKTRLYTHNVDVDLINSHELSQIEGEEREYKMRSSGIPFLVETLKKNCLSPELLTLKVGAKVMFTRNNFDEGYVNGTLGVITGFAEDDSPIVTANGSRIAVSRAEWSIEETKAVISQFPLRLAWAITVHKSQGISLDEAVIDLSKTFEYGQGYVAISRVRSLSGLSLEGLNEMAFKMHPRIVEQDKLFRTESEQDHE